MLAVWLAPYFLVGVKNGQRYFSITPRMSSFPQNEAVFVSDFDFHAGVFAKENGAPFSFAFARAAKWLKTGRGETTAGPVVSPADRRNRGRHSKNQCRG